jgi:isopenicillin-N N-acyltransferase-like protein
MGEAFGEGCRAQIHELYDIRMHWAIVFAGEQGRTFDPEEVLEVAERCLVPTRRFDPVGHEEFGGIARGARLTPAQVYVLHGLTDLRDLLGFGPASADSGCSSFIIGRDRTETGRLLLGQTWDLQTDNLPYVVLVHRRPTGAPETWSVTVTGGLSLIGLNAEGVAVGNTNLKARDSRIGVQYLSVIHRALGCRTLEEAVEAVAQSPRAGAHYYYLGGPEGTACGLECSATRCVRFDIRGGTFAHCNHPLADEIRDLEAEPPSDSSLARQQRLSALLDGHADPLSVETVKAMLSDHEGVELAICRHDHEDLNTNACVILSPETREIHACRGQAHAGTWVTRRF